MNAYLGCRLFYFEKKKSCSNGRGTSYFLFDIFLQKYTSMPMNLFEWCMADKNEVLV